LDPLLQITMSNALYRLYMVPLYGLRSYPMYVTEMQNVTHAFVMWDEANADHCLDYLLSHWPLTNPKKEALFLHETIDLLHQVSTTGQTRNKRRVFARLTRSLSSRHALVAEAAGRLLQGEGESSEIIRTSPPPALRALATAINGASEHWHPQVRRSAAALAKTVGKHPTAKTACPRKDVTRSKMWGQVAASARQNTGHALPLHEIL
jgi:hypothetical protein